MPSASTTSSPSAARRPVPVHPSALQQVVADDLVEELAGVVVQLARGRVVEDRREAALQVPGVEEERPVDVAQELGGPGATGRRPVNGGAGSS